MKSFTVKITPMSYLLIVDAENSEEAIKKAEERFQAGDYEDDENSGSTEIVHVGNSAKESEMCEICGEPIYGLVKVHYHN